MRDRLFVHVSWTTRGRARSLGLDSASFLVKFLPIIARQERARVVEMGVVQSHLHLILRLHPSTAIPRLLQRMKGGSAMLANRQGCMPRGRVLRWAKGYNVESVSPRNLEVARAYVRAQAIRHRDEAIVGLEMPDWDLNGGEEVPAGEARD